MKPEGFTPNGFTLVELLVALLLFGMLSAAGAALLRVGVDSQAMTGTQLDRLAAVVRARALLTADLAQAAPRVWRDLSGTAQPAFGGDAGALALVRRGWANDGGAARAALQRVAWTISGGRLERRAAPMVDGTELGAATALVTGITASRLRYFVGDQWRDRWDPVTADALPQAVELTLAAPGFPETRQLFLVGPTP